MSEKEDNIWPKKSNKTVLLNRKSENTPQLQQEVGIPLVTPENLWETQEPKDRKNPSIFSTKFRDPLNERYAQGNQHLKNTDMNYERMYK